MVLTNEDARIILSTMATNSDWKSYFNKLEDTLELYLVDKAPGLPTGVKEFIVAVAPWFTIVGMIVAIPSLLIVLGLGKSLVPLVRVIAPGYAVWHIVFGLVSLVFRVMAIPGLFARSKRGWKFVYYSALVGLVSSLVSFNLFSGLISVVIGLYFLFQIKSYYK